MEGVLPRSLLQTSDSSLNSYYKKQSYLLKKLSVSSSLSLFDFLVVVRVNDVD